MSSDGSSDSLDPSDVDLQANVEVGAGECDGSNQSSKPDSSASSSVALLPDEKQANVEVGAGECDGSNHSSESDSSASSPVSLPDEKVELWTRRIDTPLFSIALEIGAKQTCEVLIPFLAGLNYGDNDDRKISVAKGLGSLLKAVGDIKDQHLVLAPLTKLVESADTGAVKDAVAESILKIASEISPSGFNHFINFLIKLLVNDHCSWVLHHSLLTHILQTCEERVSDDDKASVTMLKYFHLHKEAEENAILIVPESAPTALSLVDLHKKVQLFNYNEKEATYFFKKVYRPMLMRHSNPEIRLHLIANIEKLYSNLRLDVDYKFIIREILPSIEKYTDHEDKNVRLCLIRAISEIARILGKKHTFKHLLQLILRLLKDHFYQVRINTIRTLADVMKDMPIDVNNLDQILLQEFVDLAYDTDWRVRFATVENMPFFAKELGVEQFNEHGGLCGLYLEYLTDPVYAVREAAASKLKDLVELFDLDWVVEVILPKIKIMSKSSNSDAHLSCLFSFNEMAELCGPEIISQSFLPIIIGLAKEGVPNVRMNVAKTLQRIGAVFSENHYPTEARICLDTLRKDDDLAVAQFAIEAHKALFSS